MGKQRLDAAARVGEVLAIQGYQEVASRDDETALIYTGQKAVANGQPQSVGAVLTDPQSHAPLTGKAVTFSVGSVIASASVARLAGAAAQRPRCVTVFPEGSTYPKARRFQARVDQARSRAREG